MQERSTDRLQETTYFEKCVFRSRKEKAKKEKGVSRMPDTDGNCLFVKLFKIKFLIFV